MTPPIPELEDDVTGSTRLPPTQNGWTRPAIAAAVSALIAGGGSGVVTTAVMETEVANLGGRIERHEAREGHQAVTARVSILERDLAGLERTVDERGTAISGNLQDIKDRLQQIQDELREMRRRGR